MFKAFRMLSAVAVLSFLCVEAQASDPFRATSTSSISTSSLNAMGLSGMQLLSHTDAAQIRGQGAVVWGDSFAYKSDAGSVNGYKVRGNVAKGYNGSHAYKSKEIGYSSSGYSSTYSTYYSEVGAGGFSRGYANY